MFYYFVGIFKSCWREGSFGEGSKRKGSIRRSSCEGNCKIWRVGVIVVIFWSYKC